MATGDPKKKKRKERKKKNKERQKQQRLENRAQSRGLDVRAAAQMEQKEQNAFLRLITELTIELGVNLEQIGVTPKQLAQLCKALGKVEEDKLLQVNRKWLLALAPYGALAELPNKK